MDELKNCPFCGSKAELYGEEDMVWARCSNEDCRAQRIWKFDEPEEAIKDWNNQVLQERCKALEDALGSTQIYLNGSIVYEIEALLSK